MAVFFLVLERAISRAVNPGLLPCKLLKSVCNRSLRVFTRWDVDHSLNKVTACFVFRFLPFALSKGSFLVISLIETFEKLKDLVSELP